MNPRSFRARLSQNGKLVEIRKPSGTSENVYGKSEENGWETVAEEHIMTSYQEGGAGTQRVTGGTIPRDQPRIYCKAGTAIKQGYRLVFRDGSTYEATAPMKYNTHSEFTITKVK